MTSDINAVQPPDQPGRWGHRVTCAPQRGGVRLAGRLLALALMPLVIGAAPVAKPHRIMTLTMCDDILVLMLVPRMRIASVTFLAHDAARALLPPGADAGVAINHGTAEEIVRQRPDLVIGAPFSAGTARRLARRTGAQVIELPGANSFAEVRERVLALGGVVGERARAAALVRAMDADLARLRATRPARSWRVVVWDGGGSVPGRGTMTDAIITAAGAENLAARFGDARASSFGLEELLAARPDAVLQGDGLYAQPSLHRGSARHPLIDRAFAGRQIRYSDAAYTCGLPQSVAAARALRARLQQVAPRP